MSSPAPSATADRCARLVPSPPVNGSLALAMVAVSAAPQTPLLAAVADRDAPADPPDPPDPPDAVQAIARRLLQAVVEVVGADRPVVHLLRWTTTEVYADLMVLAQQQAALSDASDRARTDRPRVVSCRVMSPGPGVAEVSCRVRHSGRSRAVAARLEWQDDRWVCTVLQLG